VKIVGIICEYNPFHLGHAAHIENTRFLLGDEVGVVCVMSPNFVQRGDFAVFNKHARAKMAILNGADLVLELPTPFALSSAESFAMGGVYILEKLGICDYISFSSESGNVKSLKTAAQVALSDGFRENLRPWLSRGVSYATALQKSAEAVMGASADVFSTPNNVLGIEYIKAIYELSSKMEPVTMKRVGGEHDSDTGFSASAVRLRFREPGGRFLCPASTSQGNRPPGLPASLLDLLPESSLSACEDEIQLGRGPVFIESAEQAILSRLRAIEDYSEILNTSGGLEHKFAKLAKNEPTIEDILRGAKSKRFVMSRLRRILICAALGITKEYTKNPPPYIRVLAASKVGTDMLSSMRKKASLPIITKPASVYKLGGFAEQMFKLEASATDVYSLAYQDVPSRAGGSEWRVSPFILN
jgi:predicted nucleotidyltransferase